MIDTEDNIKLTDFGVSNFYKNKKKLLNDNAGTGYYFSPEEWSGKQYSGADADLWACAVTLYHIVFGKLPFKAEGVNLQEAILNH